MILVPMSTISYCLHIPLNDRCPDIAEKRVAAPPNGQQPTYLQLKEGVPRGEPLLCTTDVENGTLRLVILKNLLQPAVHNTNYLSKLLSYHLHEHGWCCEH